jgi:imidazoleglycerol-phosphate dehydratase/histidinol-phosphatase
MAHKILFLDRDGTIIREPQDYRIETFDKVSFLPYVIQSLARFAHAGYKFIMVTNQEGLGAPDFTWEAFNRVNNKIIEILEGEGIRFDRIYIDEHYEEDEHPNRKPGTGLVEEYLEQNEIDLANSYMVGDRITDAMFAQNIGCNSLTIKDAQSNDGDKRVGIDVEDVPTHTFDNWIDLTDFALSGIKEAEFSLK